MTQARTPRQPQGEDLVPLTVLLPRWVKDAVGTLAAREKRSLSQVGRQAVEEYVRAARGISACP